MAISKMLQGLSKTLKFYVRFTPSFTRIGYVARLLPFRPISGNFAGQRWLVSGASGGIGKAVALMAAGRGAQVFAVGRNLDALESLVSESVELAGTIHPVLCDLASVAAIDEMARNWSPSNEINVLVNCVGILNRDYSSTHEGFETTYTTNLLGHFHLTETLAEIGCLSKGANIINVTSGGMFNVPLNLPMLDGNKKVYNGFGAYAAHKRAQVALTDYWRDTYGQRGIQAYVVHPGWADTAGVRSSLPTFRKILKPILRNAAQAADTIIWLAASRPTAIADRVWFDRKQRTTHAYSHTRQPQTTVPLLIARLDEDRRRALAAKGPKIG